MTAGWRTQRLGDLCEIVKGRKPKLKAQAAEGDLPYLIAKVMRGSQEAEFASLSDRNSIPVSEDETIIICDGSNSGEVFTGFRGILSSTMGKLVKKGPIDDAYLRAFLDSTFEVFNGAKTGAAIPHLDKEALYALPFSYPSLPEQRRIVAILDEAFDGIATAKTNAEKNLQNARELYECQLEWVFASGDLHWPERPLAQVATIINGYAFKSTDFQADPGIRSIKITNVGVREFVDDAGNYLPAAFAERHTGFTVTKGSIVLALTRTIIAGGLKVAMVPHDFDGALLNQRVAAIQPQAAELEAPFLFAYLSSRRVMNYVKARVNTLMQPNLSIADLRSLPLPLPALSAQRELVAMLGRFEEESQRLESVNLRKLASLDELKKSLLQQAFTGALTAKSTDKQLEAVA